MRDGCSARRRCVGLSTHTAAQLASGGRDADLLPGDRSGVWHGTKATGYDAVGLDGRAARGRLTPRPAGLPVVAIGGITLAARTRGDRRRRRVRLR